MAGVTEKIFLGEHKKNERKNQKVSNPSWQHNKQIALQKTVGKIL